MKHYICPCRIRCGPDAIRKMWRSARNIGNGVKASTFRCLTCGLQWDSTDFSGDGRNVACSNCYSDNVVITSFEVEVMEPKDWEEDSR